jgi:VanZ family protein
VGAGYNRPWGVFPRLLEARLPVQVIVFSRFICLGYLLLLTVFLVAPDPFAAVPFDLRSYLALSRLTSAEHFVAMLLLAVLVLAARWPLPGWLIVVLLGVYASGTELCQTFVPPRTPEVADLLQNLAGIATAVTLWYVVALMARVRRRSLPSVEGQVTAIDEGVVFARVDAIRRGLEEAGPTEEGASG